MRLSPLQNIHPIGKLLFTFLVCFILSFTFFYIGLFLAIPIFNFSPDDFEVLKNDIYQFENVNVLKYLQIIQSIVAFILTSLFITWMVARRSMEYLKFNISPGIITSIIAIAAILVGMPVINFLGEINSHLALPDSLGGLENWIQNKEQEAEMVREKLLTTPSFSALLLNIFMIAIIPAFGEEMFFRGIVQRIFTEWTKNVHWAVFITAIIFSLFHFQFYGFLPIMVLGMYLGYLFVWTKSLWVPILAHFTNNAAAVIFYFLAERNKVHTDLENIGTDNDTYYMIVVSVIIFTTLLLLLYKRKKSG